MRRRTVKPDRAGCESNMQMKLSWGKWFIKYEPAPGNHKWNYSSSWNGNDKRVVPFIEDSHGIGRSGWRCFHCGRFVWDQSDFDYAVGLATRLGHLKYDHVIPYRPWDHPGSKKRSKP